MPLTLFQKLHMVHRCWRLRFKSEVPSIRYVRNADLTGCTLLDIGANKGVFSIYMSRAAGHSGKLLAFGAQPELDVFRGGEQLLLRDKPALLFECFDSEVERGELFSYVTGPGYDGFFFHLSPTDHRSLFHKGRGKFVHHSEHADFEHVHALVKHRNYVFVQKGQQP